MNLDGLELIKRTIADLEARRVKPHPPFVKSLVPDPLTLLLAGGPKESQTEVAKLQGALAHLSPDSDRGCGSFFDAGGQPDSDIWLATVWSIASLGWASGKDIAKNWSQQCPERYTEQGFEDAWNGYNKNHPNPIGIGSLYKRAMQFGWQPNQSPAPAHFIGSYKLLTSNDLRALPPVKWRLKGVLPYEGLAALYGPSASGKSFLALDLSVALAEGGNWFGVRTAQSTVIYVALEGESGFKNRVAAWELENQRPLPTNMFMVMQPFQITNVSDVDMLAATVPHDSVVIVDTLNRAAPTSDENSSKEMGEILQACKRLQVLIGGLVALIHHTGKDTTRGARGHSSFFAALDGAIEVERSNDKRSWSIAKAKDGEDGKNFPFSLKVHTLGTDSDGDEITSCTIAQAMPNIFVKTPPQGPKQQEALRKLKNAFNASGLTNFGLPLCPQGAKSMKVEDAITHLAGTMTTTPKNKRTNEARRLMTALTASSHLESTIDASGDAWCWVSI